MLIIKWTP